MSKDFELSSGPTTERPAHSPAPPRAGLVPVSYIARDVYDISEPAVRKWIKLGCPFVQAGNRKWMDPEAVQKWVSANRAHHGHGGVRAYSGRPRRMGRPRAVARQVDEPLVLLAEQKANGYDPDAQQVSTGVVSALTLEKTRVERAKADMAELELAKERGEVLRRSDVEESLGAAARNCRMRLEAMSIRLVGEVLGACRIGTEFAGVVEDIIRNACIDVLDELVRNPLGEEEEGGGAAEVKAAA